MSRDQAEVRARLQSLVLSKPLTDPQLRVLNLGAGLQSCALALMSARGDLEPLDLAIFADTGWERAATYDYLDWLEQQVPFPIHRVSREGKDLGEYLLSNVGKPKQGLQSAPFFLSPDGILPKYCSKEFKTRVVHLELRRILGLERGQHGPSEPVVEQWLGMSNEEVRRITTSEKRYLYHRYPLIERRLNRRDLYPWFEQRQLPIPPKSSCIFCPLQDPRRLAELRDDLVDGPRLAAFDSGIRGGYSDMTGEVFLTRERRPIGDCELGEHPDQLSFGDFCEGDCGT